MAHSYKRHPQEDKTKANNCWCKEQQQQVFVPGKVGDSAKTESVIYFIFLAYDPSQCVG